MHPLYLLILVIVVLALLPTWPYSRGWGVGYWPSGLLGVILVVLLIVFLVGR